MLRAAPRTSVWLALASAIALATTLSGCDDDTSPGGADMSHVAVEPRDAAAPASDLTTPDGGDMASPALCSFAGYAPTPGGQGQAPPNALAKTPPLGWNSWNKFGCNVTDALVREIADAMVASGMRDAGYQYVVIDDCWQKSRDASGFIVPDAAHFPNGIAPVADYVHGKGLKLGIYTDAGTATCQGRPGSKGRDVADAQTYASWGVDYVKEDWCNSGGLDARVQYPLMRDALAQSGRDIVFSICEWGQSSPWEWAAPVGNLWRTTGDIANNWGSMLANFDSSATHAAVGGPGHWNDPDMLEVGNGGLTDVEDRTHMTLWALSAAPLIAGNDIRSMSQATKATLLNKEVIAIDQDRAGIAGALVSDDNGRQVWSRPLATPGQRAVALFNRTGATAPIRVVWRDLGLERVRALRELWAGKDLPSADDFTLPVAAHDVVFVKVTGEEIKPPIGASWLSDQPPAYAVTGWGKMTKDQSVDGHPITLRSQKYDKGIGMHAEGQLRYTLGRSCSKLEALVGLDDEVGGRGSVTFSVWVDGEKRFDSGVVFGGAPALPVKVDLTGANELKLVVTGGGDNIDNDHADWAMATLTCSVCAH
jgi:alpha-galactosidase